MKKFLIIKDCGSYSESGRGFTLIELLVSVGIFAIVAVLAVSALLTIVNAGEKAQSINQVMANLNTALETMARTIRTGTNYTCGGGAVMSGVTQACPGGASSISFTSAEGLKIVYSLSSSGQIMEQIGGASAEAMTDPSVSIGSLSFVVIGGTANLSTPSTVQPRVLMTVQGTVEVRAKDKVDFYLQTTMTERILDKSQTLEF